MPQQTNNLATASSVALDSFWSDIRRMASALDLLEAEAKNAPELHEAQTQESPCTANAEAIKDNNEQARDFSKSILPALPAKSKREHDEYTNILQHSDI